MEDVSVAPPEYASPDVEVDSDTIGQVDQLWVTVVWNDPVNLMSYVSWVFQNYFGYSQEKAEKLMMAIHKEGRAAVSHGPREKYGDRHRGNARIRPLGDVREGRISGNGLQTQRFLCDCPA